MTDEVTEMPRCFSSSIQSEVAWREALRARTSPATWIAPPNQQQLLGQRGLARVGVGDDGEGAAAGDFLVESGHGRQGRKRKTAHYTLADPPSDRQRSYGKAPDWHRRAMARSAAARAASGCWRSRSPITVRPRPWSTKKLPNTIRTLFDHGFDQASPPFAQQRHGKGRHREKQEGNDGTRHRRPQHEAGDTPAVAGNNSPSQTGTSPIM